MPCRHQQPGCPRLVKKSKDKVKHVHGHEVEKTYYPNISRLPLWYYYSDSDEGYKTCKCGNNRDLIHRQANHQNINFPHGVLARPLLLDPSRCSRPVTFFSRAELWDFDAILGTLPRHSDGRCCIHGRGPACFLCFPSVRHPGTHPKRSHAPTEDEESKFTTQNLRKLLKHMEDLLDEVAKEKREKNKAEEKKCQETIQMYQKALPTPWAFVPSRFPRSADEIKSELTEALADQKQLLRRSLPEALQMTDHNESQALLDQLALCSGALPVEECEKPALGNAKEETATVLQTERKKVGSANRNDSTVMYDDVEEIVDDGDGDSSDDGDDDGNGSSCELGQWY